MERGIHRLDAREAVGRPSAGAPSFPSESGSRRRRLGAIVAGAAAVGCAGALVASQLGGTPSARRHAPPRKTDAVLTAAALAQVATASRLALAHFGRAVVQSRTVQDGVLQNTGTDVITFSGRNWNDSFSEVLPGVGGAAATTQSAINRVVDGQAYDYFAAADGKRWYHVTGPDAVASMNIPDPRKLLAELAPTARFVVAGRAVLDGIPVTKLVATDPAALPALDNVQIWPGGTITGADVWVDAAGVVRQLSLSGVRRVHGVIGPKFAAQRKLLQQMLARAQRLEASRHISAAAALRIVAGSPLGQEIKKEGIGVQLISVATTVTVSFTEVGQPQTIRVPAGAITVSAVG